MRTLLHSIAAALLGVATTTTMFAGDQLFDFETDPTGVPGFILYGNRANSAYQFFDGNPASGGYLQMTDASPPGGQSAGIVFPDVDRYTNSLGTIVSLPVKAFTITMDVRVGNGTRRPADGFSISFCRQNDRALASALQNPPVFNNWAGGDSLAVASDPNGSGNPEQGTKTGLAVCFDTWAGNFLPANGVINAAGNDIEGVYIRLDDVTIDTNLFTSAAGTWNGGCYITELNPADPCAATVVTNQLTMQTGPWSGPSANTGNGGVSDGTYDKLGWASMSMEINELKQVTVIYKGLTLLNHLQLTNYPTSQGRLVLACRTGGSWEHTHIDNVHIVTVPSVQPVFQSVVGLTNGFIINVLNIAAAQTTNFSKVVFDGVDVTASVIKSNYIDISTHGFYTGAGLIPRTTHSNYIVIQDAIGGTYTNSSTFVVPFWMDLPPGIALSLAQVDTAQPGFKVKSFQGNRYQPNQLRFTEEQVIGIRGPNISDQSGATGGFFSWGGVAHFSNGGGGGLFPGTVQPFSMFGIGNGVAPAPTVADNSTIEMHGYLYFPNPGVYAVDLGSDDGYRLSFSSNPLDRMGAVAVEFDGGRGLTEPFSEQALIKITQPGCYPFRLLWENGGGGADLQWLTGNDPTNYALINDIANPNSVLAYAVAQPATSLGAYVKKANPVRDAQNVVFYQPIVVELGNGSGTRTVNQSTIVLAVDGTNQVLTVSSPDASTTRIVSQMAGKSWTVGSHTNVLTFADNAGTNYNYSWRFTVINVASNTIIPIPLANMVPAASVDATQKGFRAKSYQSPHDSPNHLSWTEMQLQGLKGPNVAAQTSTNGPGYFAFGSANAGGEGDGLLDLINNGGGTGEWSYQQRLEGSAGNPGLFGIGDNTSWTTTGFNAYRFNIATTAADSCALDIGFWLVFPSAGTYILHVNSDDNAKMLATVGSPFNKLGIVLTESSGGRGVGGAGGGQVGGDYRAISIPAAGAYAFRLVYENGGGGAGLEFSAYVVQPDGGIAKVPVNAYADPTSLRAYQTLTAGDTLAPYVSYLNPPHNHQETAYWQPVVAELTDGPGLKTVNPASITLTVDGVVRSRTVTTPGAGVTRIVQDSPNWLPVVNIAHNAILTYSDNSGTSYTNTWPFTVMNLSPFVNNQPGVEVNVPVSSMVPIGSVNHSQPGFRVYPWQTTAASTTTVQYFEEMFLNLRGANIADFSGAVGGAYYVYNDVVDLGDGYNHIPGFTGYDTDGARGAYRFNFPWSRVGLVRNGTGSFDTNHCGTIFAGYMEFPTAGLYAMSINSDDGFKVTVPFGNPRAQVGTMLGWIDVGRGNTTGTAFGPNGSVTHFVFRIPAPGAYPIRALWFNGTGGLDMEWTIYQYLPDGSVARTIVGDTNTPGAIKVYQDSSLSAPFITSMSPGLPYTLVGNGLQVMRIDRRQNMVINLQDGNTTLDISKVSFTVNGVAQPLVITQPAAGVTTVTRFGTNALPSGFFGPAEFTYVDSANNTNKLTWTILGSDYYGTVQGPYALGSGDPARPGFLWRTFQVDGAGTTLMPTHIEVAEQALAGIWTNNQANLAGTVNGFFVRNGAGANGTNGLINFNQDAPTAIGNFSSANGYPDQRIPGIPGLGVAARNADSIVGEALAYVEFPTSGIYTMGVNSDDGFRVSRGWGAPNNMGALVVNSPTSIAGAKATVFSSLFNTATVSRQVTSAITGQIVQARGVGNGATDPTFACAITNGALLNGKIALIYRGTCNERAKVQNAVDAGAIAVVYVQDRPVVTAAEGWFPVEFTVTPLMPIPLVTISRKDGDALVQALSNNTAVVNVTLQPLDGQLNPTANSPVLGQANWGKGSSDILFDVNVPTAGVYPLRLLWFEGGGGANVEWFHTPDGGPTRIILNDTNNPASLKAYYGVTVLPTVSLQISGANATANYTGTLQMADDVTGPWVDVYGQPPLVMPISTAAKKFFRSR